MLLDEDWECKTCHTLNSKHTFLCSYCQNIRFFPETKEGQKLMFFILNRNERQFSGSRNSLDLNLPKTINTFLLNTIYPGLGFIYTKHYLVGILSFLISFSFLFSFLMDLRFLLPLGFYAFFLEIPGIGLLYTGVLVISSFFFTAHRRRQLLKPFGVATFSRYIKSNTILQDIRSFQVT